MIIYISKLLLLSNKEQIYVQIISCILTFGEKEKQNLNFRIN